MEGVRRVLTDAAPEASESIAYNMPALRFNGRFLVSYQAFRNHYSISLDGQHGRTAGRRAGALPAWQGNDQIPG